MLGSCREMFEEGLNTDVTQGSLFINAYAEDYCDCVNYGLVITARCDISQGKANIFSFLPVVGLQDWLCRDFVKILKKRVLPQVRSALIAQFESIGGSEMLLNTYSIEKISDSFLSAEPSKSQKKFAETYDKYKILLDVGEHGGVGAELQKVLHLYRKDSWKILSELVAQNISGYYFFDDVCGDGPHVVLLREIHHLESEFANRLKVGYKIKSEGVKYSDGDDFSYTIGTVRSPYIEHVMQKFSELFTRIGIDDPRHDYAEKIISQIAGDL